MSALTENSSWSVVMFFLVSANQLMPKNLFVGNTIPNCSEDNQNKDKDNKNKESNKDAESFSWRDARRLPGGFLSQTVDDGSLPTPLCIVLHSLAWYCTVLLYCGRRKLCTPPLCPISTPPCSAPPCISFCRTTVYTFAICYTVLHCVTLCYTTMYFLLQNDCLYFCHFLHCVWFASRESEWYEKTESKLLGGADLSIIVS